MKPLLVYAIIPTGDSLLFDVAGADNDDDGVYTVPHGDIAAVVSASSLAHYRGLKRDQAARYLVAHQRIVEAIMADFPLLPVKFGAVLPDEAAVVRVLAQGESLFRAHLEQFAGLVQMEVVVLWHLPEIFAAISQEPEIVRLKGLLDGRPPEETLAGRVKIGQAVQAALEQRRAALRQEITAVLRELARDVVINPPMDDSMVANLALLLDEAGRATLEECLPLLDETYDGRLTFRCIGPLPPYSFAAVELGTPAFEVIDQARRCLELPEMVSRAEIRRAYHRLAGSLHPDHNRQDPAAESRMAELNQAYRLLQAYAESQAAPEANRLLSKAGGSAACTFTPEQVAQTVLVAVRRQELIREG